MIYTHTSVESVISTNFNNKCIRQLCYGVLQPQRPMENSYLPLKWCNYLFLPPGCGLVVVWTLNAAGGAEERKRERRCEEGQKLSLREVSPGILGVLIWLLAASGCV